MEFFLRTKKKTQRFNTASNPTRIHRKVLALGIPWGPKKPTHPIWAPMPNLRYVPRLQRPPMEKTHGLNFRVNPGDPTTCDFLLENFYLLILISWLSWICFLMIGAIHYFHHIFPKWWWIGWRRMVENKKSIWFIWVFPKIRGITPPKASISIFSIGFSIVNHPCCGTNIQKTPQNRQLLSLNTLP